MEKKNKYFYIGLIASTLMIVCFVAFLYIRQLNRTISDNIINSIREIAEHDKATIQAYIESCWEDLYEMEQRLVSDDFDTISELQTRMELECTTSGFTHLYLLAEDGAVYTEQHMKYFPGEASAEGEPDFLVYFESGAQHVVARFDENLQDDHQLEDSILYGVRIDDLTVNGVHMLAIIGISDRTSIRDKMVIDSFHKNGESRGHSAIVDIEGNYIVDINKEIYRNKRNNLFEHLTESAVSELTNEEVAQKLHNSETFAFYHRHVGEKDQELFYFIPFGEEIDLYFLMSINDAVFMEQSRTFVAMSMIMLVISMLAVVVMLLIVMNYQSKTIRASEKARSQKEFLSNMSHEIRTPLNGLIGINHLIMANIDDEKQKPQIKEWLKKAHSTANYLLSLVNDILDMSKLQAGKVDIIKEPLSVEALVDEVAAMQADQIKNRGVEFVVEKDITEPYIEGDVTRIKQILMNIVGNAAKFTPSGKYIKFSVAQEKMDERHVITLFRCEDAGIGMSKEYISEIFDTFSQERNRNTSGIKGTGLGMAISKLLALAMGGDINVESELNVGSTFTLAIPALIVKEVPDYLSETGATIDHEHDITDTAGVKKPVKILVAEDVELNAEILLEILSMEGFEAEHAQNGKEALDIFAKSELGEFDVILMDMQMPEMDGCTASKEIRKLEREDAKSVQIFACTANTFQEDRDLALASGMNDFLTKPIDVKILLKKIAQNV